MVDLPTIPEELHKHINSRLCSILVFLILGTIGYFVGSYLRSTNVLYFYLYIVIWIFAVIIWAILDWYAVEHKL